jgi:hypothetical protein
MRGLLPFLLIAVACAPGRTGGPGPERGRPAATLARLVLAEGNEELTPVVFEHAAHLDRMLERRGVACSGCHHSLKDDANRIPTACSECHEPVEPDGTPRKVPDL